VRGEVTERGRLSRCQPGREEEAGFQAKGTECWKYMAKGQDVVPAGSRGSSAVTRTEQRTGHVVVSTLLMLSKALILLSFRHVASRNKGVMAGALGGT
jgi:hypothetical protein